MEKFPEPGNTVAAHWAVNKQEETEVKENQTSLGNFSKLEKFPEPGNKVAVHWAQKLKNRKAQRNGILDTGATSGAAPADDEEYFDNTGQKSSKIFMLPDKR